jgi:radical SAM superfamily enzyme YgiQ (UPF0313 family)
MADIVLTTFNAKYIHAAFGLRYLMANMGDLQSRSELIEFDINQRALEIVEKLLAGKPRIIGFGVYIWNTRETEAVVELIRRLDPDVAIVLGGPEVSYENGDQPLVALADVVITGEADLKFSAICRELLADKLSDSKIVAAELPALADLALPYALYSDSDLANRVIYVEASRGCPFTCEFCLSSLEIPVRQIPLERFLDAMGDLLERGAKQFKFVDRTFNLNLRVSEAILEFFHERYFEGLFLHFEMIPDRLPERLRELIARFPAGSLQFEVGIQTFDDAVSENISRRQDYDKLADNFEFLRSETGVHIHADLIVGLPAETLATFGSGFDRLIGMRPQEIQVGILKRLKGTPIVRHDDEYEMVYSPQPPFEILRNRDLDFTTIQRMRRFARYWDLIGNSGNFVESVELIWAGDRTPFAAFFEFSDWLYARSQRRHGIALTQLVEFVSEFLTEQLGLSVEDIKMPLLRDYQRSGRSDIPMFLRPHFDGAANTSSSDREASLPKRQARHLIN